jgi:hypothetical protein
MRRLFLPLLIVLIAIVVYFKFFKKEAPKPPEPPKAQPVAVSKYSAAFNDSINHVLNDYYGLTESFVNWDTAAIRKNASALKNSLGSIRFEELKKDTAIYETAISYKDGFDSEIQSMIDNPDITAKRQNFNSFSQNLFDLLRTIRFDASKVFVQECPMAFNDSEPGIWLSNTSAIRNPYLGLHHPRYKAGMIECGETKDSLRFGDGRK